MFREEITIDDVIEFIIKNCDNVELMDKINKTSFPFTTKYLNSNNWKKGSTITLTPSVPPYGGGITYCSSSSDDLSTNEE